MNESAEFSSILTRRFSPLSQLSVETVSELLHHYELLVRWNKSLNLTSIADLEGAVLRHYCESLFLGIRLPTEAVSVLDVGSGAGFPGIPLAILRPDCRITLAESHKRKAVFLREATRHLSNVRVAACRAEEVEGTFDWVVSRAVRWLDVLKVAEGGNFGRACSGAGAPSGTTRRCASLGLLLGQDDAADVVHQPIFDWGPPIPLPWGHRRVLLLGQATA
jgi:rRNA small subunit methyltransferase G